MLKKPEDIGSILRLKIDDQFLNKNVFKNGKIYW